ncbi:MAG: hypothetical protein LBG45_07315 [Dysgonamonadaceae bacterium]|jgi:hypothetical protein|nr:hypothetical protein [Dysgonamonadaceae bacterium]
MKIDLFSTTCFEHRTDSFGIYDDSSLPAKVIPIDNGTAKVENVDGFSIYFVPLDKNIKCLRPDGTQESQCDALLICLRPQNKYDFYFLELKEANKTSGWIPDGTKQLKTTILNFQDNYSLLCISRKLAFLANKSHPYYHSSHKELMEKFRNETGFRLSICATISIKK